MEVNESGESASGDEEPRLKYERLENDVDGIVAADAVSCVCVHPKLVVVGTQWGRVHVLDHAGHSAGGAGAAGAVHAVAVNALSVDAAGEWVGSCSDDGRVRVAPLVGDEPAVALSLQRPVSAVALHPHYAAERCFLTGEDTVCVHERTFLGRVRATVVCRAEGPVTALVWGARWAAAAGGQGVRVLDVRARQSLGLLQWEPVDASARPALHWADADTLLAAWGDTIRVCRVRPRPPTSGAAAHHHDHLVDPLYTFRTDYTVCGAAPLADHLLVLGVGGGGARPVLAQYEYAQCHFSELAADTLNIRHHHHHAPLHYQLHALPAEQRYFIVSPKDIIVASPYDTDDLVEWLVAHGRWERALEALEAAGGSTARHNLCDVGARYADQLRARHQWAAAAALSARLGRHHRALWEPQLQAFAAAGQLRALGHHLPLQEEHALPPHCYELVLIEYLRLEPEGLLRLLRQWSPRLYRPQQVVAPLLDRLLAAGADERPALLEALALLYCHQRKFDKALHAYLTLRHPDVFRLISEHRLQPLLHDKALPLMRLDKERALPLLMTLPPQQVVQQLEPAPELLLQYLEAHWRAGGTHDHGRLVTLLAQHAPQRLLPLLRASDRYPMEAALAECRARSLHHETVYLLGRMGSTGDALRVILDQLGDVPQAVEFCTQHADQELWAELVRRTVDRPEWVALLIRRVAPHAGARLVLGGVPAGAAVPGLQPALRRMLGECALRLAAAAAARNVTHADYFSLHSRLVRGARRGVSVADEARCGACRQRLVAPPAAAAPAPAPAAAAAAALTVRACRHLYHARCLPPAAHCALCRPPTAAQRPPT